jgi:hypothetical protein
MSSAVFPKSSEGTFTIDREKENLLQIIARQQRLAQAGLLTASLTHDVGNFVQLISGAAYLALDSDDPEECARDSVRSRSPAATSPTSPAPS